MLVCRSFLRLPVASPEAFLGPPGPHLNPSKSKQDACKPYVRLQEPCEANCGLSGSLPGASWTSLESSKIQAKRLQTLCSFAGVFGRYVWPLRKSSWGLLDITSFQQNPSKDACKPYVPLQKLLEATCGLSWSLLGHPLDITWASRKIQATTPASPMFFFSKSLSRLLGASLARLVGTSRTSLESRKIQARRLQNP